MSRSHDLHPCRRVPCAVAARVEHGAAAARDASSTVSYLTFDDPTTAALEGREPAKLHHFGEVTLAIVR